MKWEVLHLLAMDKTADREPCPVSILLRFIDYREVLPNRYIHYGRLKYHK